MGGISAATARTPASSRRGSARSAPRPPSSIAKARPMPLAAPVTATAAPGIAVIFRSLRHSRGSATESGSGRRDQGEIKKAGTKKPGIKKPAFWLAASFSSFELVPGQSEAPPGLLKLLLLRLLGLFRLLCLLRFLSHSILF